MYEVSDRGDESGERSYAGLELRLTDADCVVVGRQGVRRRRLRGGEGVAP